MREILDQAAEVSNDGSIEPDTEVSDADLRVVSSNVPPVKRTTQFQRIDTGQ
jgi:hypothetical protein